MQCKINTIRLTLLHAVCWTISYATNQRHSNLQLSFARLPRKKSENIFCLRVLAFYVLRLSYKYHKKSSMRAKLNTSFVSINGIIFILRTSYLNNCISKCSLNKKNRFVRDVNKCICCLLVLSDYVKRSVSYPAQF